MSERVKFPYRVAMGAASELKRRLAPFCERIEIAGSLRRGKPEVGDIEILFIGFRGTRKVDLLSEETFCRAGEMLDSWLPDTISKRPNKNGVFAWGEKNRLGIHNGSGIPVDFFSTNDSCWWNSLVCRTGGKENNLLITTTAQRQGWSFQAYGSGFQNLRTGEHHDTTSERDVYEFIGLPYLEPHERK